MPKTIAKFVTLYTFDELSPAAKEKAREWYREGYDDLFSDFSPDHVLDNARRMGELLGIQFDDGGIRYSVFGSQGDGASFTGRYTYAPTAAADVRKEAPTDTELHRIADELERAQRRNHGDLIAEVKRTTFAYCHENTVSIYVSHSGESEEEDHGRYDPVDKDDVEDVRYNLRAFMRWIYDSLKVAYEYQTSDEQVDEAIRANEYTFDIDGRRCEG